MCHNSRQIINTSSTILSFTNFFFFQNPQYSYIQEHLTPSTCICIFPCFFMIYQSCHDLIPNPRILKQCLHNCFKMPRWWADMQIMELVHILRHVVMNFSYLFWGEKSTLVKLFFKHPVYFSGEEDFWPRPEASLPAPWGWSERNPDWKRKRPQP